MEYILLIVVIFLGGYLFVYIIDSLKGETNLIKKYKNDKLKESIGKKLLTGEKLTDEETDKIVDDMVLRNLAESLIINEIKNDKKEKK